MTKLIADMSMSLDGKIATPTTTSPRSFDWFFDGDTEVGPVPRLRAERRSCSSDAFGTVGALIGGRRYFDLAEGWGGNHPMGVPVYILTHEPPADWPEDSTIHFVTDGLESAVAQATRGRRRQGHRRRDARASCASASTPACSTSCRSTSSRS